MTPTKQTERDIESSGFGMTLPFDQIDEPGTYVCNWNGHLLRVPEDGVKDGRSPLLSIRANEALYVTKISENPFIPVSKARVLAADHDIMVNF